ncbi:hypothetical protein LTR09_008145 [Extremus antarcticus]|uniref:DUF6590 domain-containing protein n=1 Tax=Extremus antarcticus TaxID=702011 RepID=A0AAJ0GAQ3_9PEZI|nr:hypothetical protein LTR09_008145 [Extremus antarcticus]
MSSGSGGITGPFYHQPSRQQYWYDIQSDTLIFANGQRQRRPANVPRSQLMNTTVPAIPPGFQYQGSPPTHPSYTTSSQDSNALHEGFADLSIRGSTHREQQPSRSQYAGTQQPREDQQGLRQHPTGTVAEKVYAQGHATIVERYNDGNEVRTLLKDVPSSSKKDITDPELYDQGVRAHVMLMKTGDEGDEEKLFSTFKVRPQPRRFFTLGKVFMVLWVEPAGESRTLITSWQPGTTQGRYGEAVFSKVRRFVVIREGANYCSAVPIATYGHQGTGKPGVVKSEHAIIYTGRSAPRPLLSEEDLVRGEEPMRPEAIRVDPDEPEDKLDPRSRVDFGKVHTIQHNIKVRAYGKVNEKSLRALVNQFGNVWKATTTSTPVAGPSSSRGQDARAGPSVRRESTSSGHAARPRQPISRADSATYNQSTKKSRASEATDSDDEGGDDDAQSERAKNPRETMQEAVRAYIRQMMEERNCSREEATRIVQEAMARQQQNSEEEEDDDDDDDDDEDEDDEDDDEDNNVKAGARAETRDDPKGKQRSRR